MTRWVNSVLADIGLADWPPFLKDRLFVIALLSGSLVWVALWFTAAPTFSVGESSLPGLIFLTVVWHPVLEEIFFRGVVQGVLRDKPWGRKTVWGLSIANVITSLLFVCAHMLFQPWMWAVSVFIPSLIFGFFRDRYASIYPCILLHAFYNAGFIGVNLLAQ